MTVSAMNAIAPTTDVVLPISVLLRFVVTSRLLVSGHRAGPQSGVLCQPPRVTCRTPVPSARITTMPVSRTLAKVIHFPSGEKEPETTACGPGRG